MLLIPQTGFLRSFHCICRCSCCFSFRSDIGSGSSSSSNIATTFKCMLVCNSRLNPPFRLRSSSSFAECYGYAPNFRWFRSFATRMMERREQIYTTSGLRVPRCVFVYFPLYLITVLFPFSEKHSRNRSRQLISTISSIEKHN